jgi:hypothetical protein
MSLPAFPVISFCYNPLLKKKSRKDFPSSFDIAFSWWKKAAFGPGKKPKEV